jgi:hypothetical protein
MYWAACGRLLVESSPINADDDPCIWQEEIRLLEGLYVLISQELDQSFSSCKVLVNLLWVCHFSVLYWGTELGDSWMYRRVCRWWLPRSEAKAISEYIRDTHVSTLLFKNIEVNSNTKVVLAVCFLFFLYSSQERENHQDWWICESRDPLSFSIIWNIAREAKLYKCQYLEASNYFERWFQNLETVTPFESVLPKFVLHSSSLPRSLLLSVAMAELSY